MEKSIKNIKKPSIADALNGNLEGNEVKQNISYTDKLKDPRWQRKRLEIMQRDNWKCKLCGDEKTTLNVHHILYIKGLDPWEYDNKHLTTLCEECHNEVELLKKDGMPNFEQTEIFKRRAENGMLYFIIRHQDFLILKSYYADSSYYFGINPTNSFILKLIRINDNAQKFNNLK